MTGSVIEFDQSVWGGYDQSLLRSRRCKQDRAMKTPDVNHQAFY